MAQGEFGRGGSGHGRDRDDQRPRPRGDHSRSGGEASSYGMHGDWEDGEYGREGGMGRGAAGGGARDPYAGGAGYGGIGYGGQGHGAGGSHSGAGSHSGSGYAGAQGGRGFVGRGPKGYKRSDARIEEEISEALMRHPAIDASDVEVRVKDGEVMLSGTVDSRGIKRLIEDIAHECMGVVDVSNGIRVARPGDARGDASSDAQPRTHERVVAKSPSRDDSTGARPTGGRTGAGGRSAPKGTTRGR